MTDIRIMKAGEKGLVVYAIQVPGDSHPIIMMADCQKEFPHDDRKQAPPFCSQRMTKPNWAAGALRVFRERDQDHPLFQRTGPAK